MLGKVIAWVKKEGGLAEMERRSLEKSQLVYSIIDESHGFYSSPVEPSSRLVTCNPQNISNIVTIQFKCLISKFFHGGSVMVLMLPR